MAEYKALRGLTIRTIDGDASPLITGDIWYNSSAKKIKGAKIGAGTFATGGDLNTANYGRHGCGASQSAALVAGGGANPSTADSEEYDGSTWTEGNNLNQARTYGGSGGTQTAGIIFAGVFLNSGGSPSSPDVKQTTAETYNGTSWTEVNDLNTARQNTTGCGTTTSALCFGGNTGSVVAVAESWNGTAWTEVNDLNTARKYLNGAGETATAALCIGGQPARAIVESYDGSSWTEVNDLNTGRNSAATATQGTNTSTLITGGAIPSTTTNTELWDGTSWTETTNASVSRTEHAGAGVQADAIFMGGNTSPKAQTEEWTMAVAAVTFTSS